MRATKRGAGWLLASVGTLALLQAHGATAQAVAPPAGQEPGAVSEVVVTADKRAERLLDTPQAVTAVTDQDLARFQAVRLADYVAQVPGLNLLSEREGETQIILRGISTGGSPGALVGTYVDDTPYGSSTVFALGGLLTPDLDPGDLQRIEVLRGPQGTLYGSSSEGGLIKYVTTPPNLHAYSARAEIDGSAGDGGGEGYAGRLSANIPIVTDKLALRVSGFYRRDPGFIDDAGRGVENIDHTRVEGLRASLLWKPIEKLSAKLTIATQNLSGPNTSQENVEPGTLDPTYGDLQQRAATDQFLRVRYRIYSADIDYDLGFADFTTVTSYSTMQQNQVFDYTSAFGPLLTGLVTAGEPIVTVGSNIGMSRWTEEARLASKPGLFEWRLGFFFDHERSVREEPVNLYDPANGGAQVNVPGLVFGQIGLLSRYTEYAGFADATYHFTPKLDLQAGIRYSSNDQTYSQPTDGILVGGSAFLVGASSEDATTFQVTPRYRFTDDQMIYAKISSGYRPGGPNAHTPNQVDVATQFSSDSLTNYEVGYKAALLDKKVTLDLSAFYIDWSDIQIIVLSNGVSSLGNGKGARSTGFEAAATYEPIRGLRFSGNLAYTNAELTDDAPGVNGKNGDRLPNVPEWAGTLNGDYDFKLDRLPVFVGATIHYTGDRYAGFASGSPDTYQRPLMPDYTTVDVRAGVEFHNVTLQVYAKNLGDERGFNDVTSSALDGYSAPLFASIIQPRTFGFALSAAF